MARRPITDTHTHTQHSKPVGLGIGQFQGPGFAAVVGSTDWRILHTGPTRHFFPMGWAGATSFLKSRHSVVVLDWECAEAHTTQHTERRGMTGSRGGSEKREVGSEGRGGRVCVCVLGCRASWNGDAVGGTGHVGDVVRYGGAGWDG